MPKNNSKARRDIRAGEAKTRLEVSRPIAMLKLQKSIKDYIRVYPDDTFEQIAEDFGIHSTDNWRYEVLQTAWVESKQPRRVSVNTREIQDFRGWLRGRPVYKNDR